MRPKLTARAWLVQRFWGVRWLLLAASLFAGIFAWWVSDPDPAGGVLVLSVVPVVICAIDRGVLGGALAAGLVLGFVGLWDLFGDEGGVRPQGQGLRAATLLFVGLIVGGYAASRRELQRRLEHSIEVAADMQCVAGFDGYFKRVNPAWCALLGYSEKQLTAIPFVEFVHPEDRERTIREAKRLAGTDTRTVSFENRYRTRDGSYRWLAWTAHAVPDDGAIYATARDITAQREHRDRLERLVTLRTHELQAAVDENLQHLALAAEYRDDDTHRHTERVGSLSALLAQRLRQTPELAKELRQAAPLHDVGKLGIPDAILLKPGPLTDDERWIMQTHTTIGADILAGSHVPVLQLAEQIALNHHERWDGTGYPNNLKGSAIPLAARIVAVVDVFDALTHERPYKAAWPLQDAVNEIIAASGSQFDPAVVEAFEGLHRAGTLELFVDDVSPTLTLAAAAPHPSMSTELLRADLRRFAR